MVVVEVVVKTTVEVVMQVEVVMHVEVVVVRRVFDVVLGMREK